MIYLDNSATTRAYDAAADAVRRMMLDNYGNPSSLHSAGFAAEKELKRARRDTAAFFGVSEKEIIFTSGGTEGDNMAIRGAYNAAKRRSRRIITTTVEHPAVLETVKKLEQEGAEAVYIGVDRDSRLDVERLREEASKGAAVISIMAVNNETGAKMPICRAAEVKGEAVLHCDAVQALGKEDLKSLPADPIPVSAHKIHGPKGVGALVIKKGTRIDEIISGGGQEQGLRSGTENMPGICGFAEALRITGADTGLRDRMARMRKLLLDGILDQIPDVRVNSPEDGCPAILNVSFLGTRGEVLLHRLEGEGICVSTGSACSSGKKGGSHVLRAMGLTDEEVAGAIRFSFGAFNTEEEMPVVVDKLKKAVSGFRKLGSFR